MTGPGQWWRDWSSRAWFKNILWTLAFLLVFFGVRAWQQQAMPKGVAPVFAGVTVNGQTVSLADYRGKPLLLYFWASWCKICEFEQGSIRALAKDYPLLSVALRSGNALQLGKYMDEHNFHITTVVDEYGEIASRYGVRGTPTTFFIDANGEIRSVEVGYTSEIGMRIRLWLAGL